MRSLLRILANILKEQNNAIAPFAFCSKAKAQFVRQPSSTPQICRDTAIADTPVALPC